MANDTWTVLNLGSGGDNMDESAIAYGGDPTTRKRPRIVIGDDTGNLSPLLNSPPVGTEYGVVTRPVETVAVFSTASASVTNSAGQINSGSIAATIGVQLKASITNTGTIYFGASGSVTAGTNAATDGLPLAPGEALILPVNNVSLIYAISDVGTQTVFFGVF